MYLYGSVIILYRMHRRFGNRWVEYQDPIDLMYHSSNMEIGLYWYWKGSNNKYAYDLTKHLMVDLQQ